ncbi:MAG TPA: nickel ABC transporter substrate-binding protein [Candidatus Ruminococcus avistercoris]|nr:nickel ABC transporter substrate-binding protein [Candidatus Ruminococcus avistercoris]
MKIMKRLWIVLLAGMVMLSSGCSTGGTDNETQENAANDEKVVTALVSTDIKPEEADTISGDSICFQMLEMIYEPLVRYGEGGKIEPALARDWEISEDGKEYTFYLREDVKFSDGTDFNADNVLFNVQRWGEQKTFSANLLDVQKKDDYTVTFFFDEVAYPVLTEFTYPRPYRMLGENGVDQEGVYQSMIGTGQWMIESYESNQEVILVPNPYYYGDSPKIDKVIFRLVQDGQSRTMAMQSQEADICFADIPSENRSVVEADDHLSVLECNPTQSFYLILNYENEMLQDERVRQALNYATDRESIVNDLLDGAGTPAEGLFPPGTPYVTKENSPGYEYDPEKASQLLKDAGYEDSDGDGILEKDGQKLSLKLVFQTEEYANWKSICEYLQSEYASIGIEVELNQLESAGYYDAIWTTRDYDMVIYRTYEDSWNPHGFLESMFVQTEGNPAVSWYDEEISGEIQKVLKTMDENGRTELYHQILTQMHDKAVCVPLYYPSREYVYNNRLSSVEAAATSYEGIIWSSLEISDS